MILSPFRTALNGMDLGATEALLQRSEREGEVDIEGRVTERSPVATQLDLNWRMNYGALIFLKY